MFSAVYTTDVNQRIVELSRREMPYSGNPASPYP
jgi:hypothetical protein